jgi:acyl-CoA thioester hydrolase
LARIKIDLPKEFRFQVSIPVRITDVNYGGHVGNDAILSLMHEARMQYLAHYNYSELNFEGIGLIMSDVGIEFKNELFYGESIRASVVCGEFTKIGFDLYYKFEKQSAGKMLLVAAGKTGMVCFNYDSKKITVVPEAAKSKLGLG